jgi:hypothetical protein
MKLSFSSTPALIGEPWNIFEKELSGIQVQEYFFGCMFLAWGQVRESKAAAGV